MKEISTGMKKAFLTIGTLLGWFALIAQFYLLIEHRVTIIPEAIIRYFSFFTILTNILVAITFTVLLTRQNSSWYHFFSRANTLTAVTAYITLVGVVYQVILRAAWNPQGLQKIVDELLHSVIPALAILYWFLFVRKTGLKWKHVFPWAIYPVCYLLYILIRGAFSGFYPYPFVNVSNLGYKKVLINSGFTLLAFFLFAFLLIAIGRLTKRATGSPELGHKSGL
jgi:hypothetical protein